MHYFTFAEKDTTLYQDSGSLNAGLDEVLEIRKEVSDTGDTVNVSRVLIKFDLSYISQSIVRGLITNPKYYLNLYDANSQNLATTQSLYAYPVSGAWTMGEGRSYDNPVTTEGASWKFTDGEIGGTIWPSQNVTTPCRKGLTVFWPAGHDYLHAGAVSYKHTKLITTGWIGTVH